MIFGGGSIQGMQSAYKSNIDQIKKFSPLKVRERYLGYKHINSHDDKHFSAEEMAAFKRKLRKQKMYNLRVSLAVLVSMILILALIIFIINGTLSF